MFCADAVLIQQSHSELQPVWHIRIQQDGITRIPPIALVGGSGEIWWWWWMTRGGIEVSTWKLTEFENQDLETGGFIWKLRFVDFEAGGMLDLEPGGCISKLGMAPI